jgi:hypothetical protein
MFAQAMKDYIGCRTKLFPWFVKKVLDEPDVTKRLSSGGGQQAETEIAKKAIVAACKTIARAEAKATSAKKEKEQKDKRDKTPQLIYLGPGQARDFVNTLLTLRDDERTADCYRYFLDPATVFESLLEPELALTTLTEEQREKALKAGWRIRNTETRLSKLREVLRLLGSEEDSAVDADQPFQPDDEQIAKEIARGLEALAQKDEKEFGKVVSSKGAKGEPKMQAKREKPPRYDDDFVEPLKRTTFKISVDIALFGRMTTSDYIADVEAAMQVAHAISTHEVINEVDYFTAVDDLGQTGGGAAHVDEAMFNSACFYKYFCLDWDQLVHNLAGPEPSQNEDPKGHQKWKDEVKPQAERLAACTLGHFVRAAALTTPSGKQNSFASNCEACGILVEIKKNAKIPTSYANAFAEPARKIGDPPDDAADCVSLVGRSIAQFGDHVYSVRNAHGIVSTLLWYSHKPWRYPLQGWEREEDGQKKKENGKEKPPVKFADQCFRLLTGEEGQPGLVEAVVEQVVPRLKWADVCNAGNASPKET